MSVCLFMGCLCLCASSRGECVCECSELSESSSRLKATLHHTNEHFQILNYPPESSASARF